MVALHLRLSDLVAYNNLYGFYKSLKDNVNWTYLKNSSLFYTKQTEASNHGIIGSHFNS